MSARLLSEADALAAEAARPPSIEPARGALERLARFDFARAGAELDQVGWALLDGLLTPDECGAIAALYEDEARFRSTVVMARHHFGRGEYKYFNYPLPEPIDGLRAALYAALVPTARRWREA